MRNIPNKCQKSKDVLIDKLHLSSLDATPSLHRYGLGSLGPHKGDRSYHSRQQQGEQPGQWHIEGVGAGCDS